MNLNILLIGFMGSGKTTVGKCLSSTLNMDVVDTDHYIYQNSGLSANEMFDLHGEDYFRNCETKAIKSICLRDNIIISCGGGIVIRGKNVRIMKKNGIIVFLDAKPSTIYERLKKDVQRPLLKQNMTLEFISDFLGKRNLLYQGVADIVVQTDNKTPENICMDIIRQVNI